jgi:hypothetical protein
MSPSHVISCLFATATYSRFIQRRFGIRACGPVPQDMLETAQDLMRIRRATAELESTGRKGPVPLSRIDERIRTI